MMKPIMLESIEQLDAKLVEALVKKHNLEALPRFKKLKNYYLGKHDILNRAMADKSKPNNKIANPYASYITDMIQGYFLGKPITYTSGDDIFLDAIQDIYNANDEQAHNSLLSKDMSIYGVAYELVYINEVNELKMAQLPVEEVFMIYDTSINPKPIGAVRHYKVTDYITGKDIMKVEVYKENTISFYKQGKQGLVLTEEIQHYFNGVPVIPYFNNDEELGDFEKVIPIIDAYDKSVSDQVNEMEYFADAYLVITGMSDTPVEEFADMKNNRMMLLGDNGKAEWLVKTSDNATIESYKTRLQKDIHKFSHVVDLSDENFGGNLSGVALEYKFQGLNQVASNKERLFKQSLSARSRLIVNILNIKGNNFDADELKPVFTRNLPVNLSEHIQLAKDLTGTVSKETLLAQLPFIEDVQEELDKIQAERDGEAPDLSYDFPQVDTVPTIEDAV